MIGNIDLILKGFNNKTLSIDEYVRLAGVELNLGTVAAYESLLLLSKNRNLTVNDLINYKSELTLDDIKKYTSDKEEFGLTDDPCSTFYKPKSSLLQNQSIKIKKYCTDNPSDKACVCVNTSLVRISQDEKEDQTELNKYCAWKTRDNQFELEYQIRMKNYLKRYKDKENELKIWRTPVERGYWYNGEPKNNLFTDKTRYAFQKMDTYGVWLWQTYDWDAVYASSYITEELDRFRKANHPDEVSPRVREDQPNLVKRPSLVQCCNNSIDAGKATLENIVQICNQSAILNPEQMEEAKKKAEEQRQLEEDEIKRQEDEDAIIEAEIASAKKKKIFQIFLIGFIVLIFLGVLTFMYFKFSKEPIVSTTPSEQPIVSTTPSSP